jgi:hypothetical protein
MRIRDPGSGMEKVGSGINIPDPQHWFCFRGIFLFDYRRHRFVLGLIHSIADRMREKICTFTFKACAPKMYADSKLWLFFYKYVLWSVVGES